MMIRYLDPCRGSYNSAYHLLTSVDDINPA